MSYPQDDARPSDTEFGANRIVTAFFDDREEAMRAIERLTASGISRNAINLVEGASSADSETYMDNGIHDTRTQDTGTQDTRTQDMGHSGTGQRREKGFFESLADFFIPEDDRHAYAEGLNRGGYVVTARVDDEHYGFALDILDDEGTVDIGTREQTWRSEGWSPSAMAAHQTGAHLDSANTMSTSEENMSVAGMTGAPLSGVNTPGAGTAGSRMAGSDLAGSDTESSDMTHTGMAGTETTRSDTEATRVRDPSLAGANIGAAAQGGDSLRDGEEEVLPITEETLRVGKRDVNHGRIRVRSYVIEEPVSENVTLRQEHVQVERRDADRTVRADDALFQDRTIEIEERGEEAVVSKTARVTGEVVIRKDATERTEEVRDTVRRTEVEIEDDRDTGHDTMGTRRS
jgi:uncharacterized protein (TIGR02271 family)